MLLLTFYTEQIKNIKQNKKIILSFIIVCILLILSMLPLLGSLNTNKDIAYGGEEPINIMQILKEQSVANINFIVGYHTNFLICIMIVVSIIICVIYECKNYIKNFIIITISIIYQFVVCGYILGSTSSQKANAIIMVIFLFVWIQNINKEKEESKLIKVSLIFLLGLNIVYGVKKVEIEIDRNYSSAKEASMYINEYIEKGSIIITNNLPYCSAIIPYTNNLEFWNLLEQEDFSFVNWNGKTCMAVDDIEKIKESLDEIFDKSQKVYLVYIEFDEDETKELEKNMDLTKVFECNEAIELGEYYKIYEITRN